MNSKTTKNYFVVDYGATLNDIPAEVLRFIIALVYLMNTAKHGYDIDDWSLATVSKTWLKIVRNMAAGDLQAESFDVRTMWHEFLFENSFYRLSFVPTLMIVSTCNPWGVSTISSWIIQKRVRILQLHTPKVCKVVNEPVHGTILYDYRMLEDVEMSDDDDSSIDLTEELSGIHFTPHIGSLSNYGYCEHNYQNLSHLVSHEKVIVEDKNTWEVFVIKWTGRRGSSRYYPCSTRADLALALDGTDIKPEYFMSTNHRIFLTRDFKTTWVEIYFTSSDKSYYPKLNHK